MISTKKPYFSLLTLEKILSLFEIQPYYLIVFEQIALCQQLKKCIFLYRTHVKIALLPVFTVRNIRVIESVEHVGDGIYNQRGCQVLHLHFSKRSRHSSPDTIISAFFSACS